MCGYRMVERGRKCMTEARDVYNNLMDVGRERARERQRERERERERDREREERYIPLHS